MPEPDLMELFLGPLNRLGVRYLVSGSVAAMLYGEPRVTHDINFVIFLREEDALRLSGAFAPPEFYFPPIAVVRAEMAWPVKGQFNILHARSGLKAGFYTVNRDELHGWAFCHHHSYAINGMTINLAPPEYVILRELEYHREGGSAKHLRDIRAMLAVSGAQIDHPAMADWLNPPVPSPGFLPANPLPPK